jgi:hypothetical protein
MVQTVWGLRVAVWGHVVLKYRGEVYQHGNTARFNITFAVTETAGLGVES